MTVNAVTSEKIDTVNPVARLFDALELGDADAARDALTDDARIWHNFDRIEQDRDRAHAEWVQMIARFPERRATDVQRLSTENGFVQRHNWVMSPAPGKQMAFAVCVVVEVKNDKIFRLYEYIDRTGHFTPDADA